MRWQSQLCSTAQISSQCIYAIRPKKNKISIYKTIRRIYYFISIICNKAIIV